MTNPQVYEVIHPLDDIPEAKRSVDALGPMLLTPGVKIALFILRAYLVVMGLLVLYRVVTLCHHH